MHAPSKSLESSLLEQGRRDREEVTEETKMETKMEAKDEVKLEAASSGFGRHELRGNPTKKDLQDPNLKSSSLTSQDSRPSTQFQPITPQKPTITTTSSTNHLPPTPDLTPDPTPTKRLKRSYDIANLPPTSAQPLSKRILCANPPQPHLQSPPSPSPSKSPKSSSSTATNKKSPFKNVPEWSIMHKTDSIPSVSPHELKRAAERILTQVDWRELATYVASNRSGRTYEKIMRGLLQGKINDLVGERGEESNELYVIGREEMDYRADVEP